MAYKKVCRFCEVGARRIDYKDGPTLERFGSTIKTGLHWNDFLRIAAKFCRVGPRGPVPGTSASLEQRSSEHGTWLWCHTSRVTTTDVAPGQAVSGRSIWQLESCRRY